MIRPTFFAAVLAIGLFALPVSNAMANFVLTFSPIPTQVAGSGSTGALDIIVTNNCGADMLFGNGTITGGTDVLSSNTSVVTVGGSIASTLFPPATLIADGASITLTGLTYVTTASTNSTATISSGTIDISFDDTLGTPGFSGGTTTIAPTTFTAVPEPTTLTTFCAAIAGLCLRRRRFA